MQHAEPPRGEPSVLRQRRTVVACVLDEEPRELLLFVVDEPEVVEAGQG